MLIDRTHIDAAYETIQRSLAPTPLVRSYYLSRKLGANIWLKLETLQPTHSFKVRGAFNAMRKRPADQWFMYGFLYTYIVIIMAVLFTAVMAVGLASGATPF